MPGIRPDEVQLKPDAKIDLQADATSEDPFPHQQAGEHCTRQRRTSEFIQLLEYQVISGTWTISKNEI
jgi:hypothetical protein